MRRVQRVYLTDPTAEAYLKHSHLRAADYRRLRAHKIITPDPLTAFLARMEDLFRIWLGTGAKLTTKRVLGYSTRGRNNQIVNHFRELDAVIGSEDEPVSLVEFKCSVNLRPLLSKGRKQVLECLKIAQQRWPKVAAAVVGIDASALLDGSDSNPKSIDRRTTPDETICALANLRGPICGTIPSFRFSIEEFFELDAVKGLSGYENLQNDLKSAFLDSTATMKRLRLEESSTAPQEFRDSHFSNPTFATVFGDLLKKARDEID